LSKPTMSDKDKKEAQTDDITEVDQEIVYRHMPAVLYVDTGIKKEVYSEDVEVKPKDTTVTVPTKQGLMHKPDTQMDLYNRRQRRSKQHL
jgi:hypothetical protein